MVRLISGKISVFFGVFFLAGILVFTGCFGRPSAFEKDSLSPNGLMAEDGFPSNILFVAAFQNTSESQKADLAKLKTFFPMIGNSDMDNGPFSSLQKMGLSYEEDIVPLFSESNRMVFGITEGDMSVGYLSVQNRDAFSRIEKKLMQSTDVSAKTEVYKDADISTYPQMTIVKYKDLAFLLSTQDEAHSLIDRMNSKENLRNNPTYQAVVRKLVSPYVGYFYLDAKAMMRQSERKLQETSSYSPQSLLNNSVFNDLISAYGFVLQATNGGITLSGYISGDKQAMKKAGVRFSDLRGVGRYFTDQISPDGLMFYNEGKNLKEAMLRMKETTPEQYDRYRQTVQTWLSLDIEKDLAPWMDGPYLFSLYQNEKNYFPGLTFTVNSSKAKDLAKNFANTLFERLNTGLSVLLLQFDYLKSAVVLGEISSGSDKLYRLTVDFSKIPEEVASGLPEQLNFFKGSVVSLTFGVKGDFFFVSLYDNAEAIFDGGHLRGNETYIDAVSRFSSPDGEIFYVNVSEGVSYLDSVLESLRKLNILKEEEQKQFENIREFLKPFVALLFKVRADGYDEYVEGFVKVGNP